METDRLDPVFKAVLEDTRALERVLNSSPGSAVARMVQGYLVRSIPHALYVGDTPLHLAAASLRGWAARMLLERGADPNAANRRGASPLHYACDPRPRSSGVWDPPAQVEMIGLLLDAGADVNATDRSGVTPLHRSVRARSPAAVRQLLARGARVNAPTGRGTTPLQMVQHSTGASGTAGTIDERREIIELLERYGAVLS
jgi:ankyrin repeat protein